MLVGSPHPPPSPVNASNNNDGIFFAGVAHHQTVYRRGHLLRNTVVSRKVWAKGPQECGDGGGRGGSGTERGRESGIPRSSPSP